MPSRLGITETNSDNYPNLAAINKNNYRFMQDVIFDTLPPLNSNLAKNSFLPACSSPSAGMPVACPSFMTIIRQFQNNFSQSASIQNALEDGLSDNCSLKMIRAHLRNPRFRTPASSDTRGICGRSAAALGLLPVFVSVKKPEDAGSFNI